MRRIRFLAAMAVAALATLCGPASAAGGVFRPTLEETTAEVFHPIADAAVSRAGIGARRARSVVIRRTPRRAMVLRFDLRRATAPIQRARLTVRVAGSRRGLVVSRRGGGAAHRPVRGVAHAGRRVAFDVTGLVRTGRRVELKITTRRRTPTRIVASERGPASAPRLVVELGPPAPAPAPPGGDAPPPAPAPPPRDAAQPFVVMAAGDIACSPTDAQFNGGLGTATECRQMATSDLLVAHNPDLVLPLGDLQYEGGRLAHFLASYHPSWGRVKAKTRPALGNHDQGWPQAGGYFDYFHGPGVDSGVAGERGLGWYSFDLGAWHLVALNTVCVEIPGGCAADSPQVQWLRADLAAHRDRCVLAYMHNPRFSSGGHGSDPELQPFWDALYEAGTEVVLAGHEHNYERFGRQDAAGNGDGDHGIRQFIVGTGGRSLRRVRPPIAHSEVLDNSSFGVLKVTLRTDGYDWQFVPVAGSGFTDSGSGGCHSAP